MDTNYRTLETRIRGVRVELELFEDDGEPRSNCMLSVKTEDGSRYIGSLALCQAEGGIPYDFGGPDDGAERYTLSDSTMETIEEWAYAHGY